MPFVGVVAIGLLVVAGRLFFVDSLQPSHGSVSPLQELDIALENAERFALTKSTDLEVFVIPDSPSGTGEGANVPEEAVPTPSHGSELDGLLAVTVTPVAPEPAAAPAAPSKPKTVTAKSTSNATVRADNTSKSKNTKATTKAASQPTGPWRVQVGAYGSKQAANEIVSKLAKSGFKATVFSGPKFHKVWVQAGNSRSAAEAAVSRLKKLGYAGSYVVPPAK